MKSLIGWVAIPLLALQTMNPFSIGKERAMGRQLAAELRGQAARGNNSGANSPILDAYVKRVGSQLAAGLPETPLTWSFEVIPYDAAEPVPLPGGYILVPANFFLSARDSDEFAAMLAHSIAHSALQHAQVMKTRTLPLVFMGALHAESRRGLSIPLGLIENQRTRELEADKFGLELASRAGYDPGALSRYILHTQPAVSDSRYSPLPERELRLARIDQLLRRLPAARPTTSEEFQRCQEAARPVSTRPRPRQEPPSLFRKN